MNVAELELRCSDTHQVVFQASGVVWLLDKSGTGRSLA